MVALSGDGYPPAASYPAPQLPFSTLHVILGWADLFSDLFGIIGTAKLIQQLQPFCSMDPRPFFHILLILQVVLLVGNMTTQAVMAAINAARVRRESGGGGGDKLGGSFWSHPAAAFLRGLCGLELAFHEWGRRVGGKDGKEARAHICCALNYKLAELVWEAPQVVVSWTVVLTHATVMMMSGKRDEIRSADVTLNVLSGCVGIVSLTLGALDYMRTHPSSFWAVRQPPSRLFLGIIDTSRGTWWRSLVMGLYACFSLLNRACLYMLLFSFAIQNIGSYDQIWVIQLILGVAIAVPSSFVLNVLLLIPMKSWRVLPSAFISMWINMPWVAARRPGESAHSSTPYVRLRSCWAAWVIEFLYSFVTLFVAVVSLTMGVADPCSGGTLVGFSHSITDSINFYPPYVVWVFMLALPVTCVVACLGLFMGMTGWIVHQRRRAAAGKLSPEAAEAVEPVTDLPASLHYKWHWRTMTTHLSEGPGDYAGALQLPVIW